MVYGSVITNLSDIILHITSCLGCLAIFPLSGLLTSLHDGKCVLKSFFFSFFFFFFFFTHFFFFFFFFSFFSSTHLFSCVLFFLFSFFSFSHLPHSFVTELGYPKL